MLHPEGNSFVMHMLKVAGEPEEQINKIYTIRIVVQMR